MNVRNILLIVITMLIATTALVAADPGHEGVVMNGNQHGNEALYQDLGAVLSTVNAALCAALILIYLNTWKKTKSDFTIGLIVLSLALLFHSLVSNPMLHDICGYRGLGLGPFMVLPQLFTTIALGILIYLSSR